MSILDQVIKNHTTVNYSKGNSGRKYIVIHYTGNASDSAKGNANYFKSANRGSSAHYFVDTSSIYEVVSPSNTAWAVGRNYGSNNLFGKCMNSNSISIELCSQNSTIPEATISKAVELTKALMAKYGIDANHVVRHYDVCSKRCPGWTGWLPGNESKWNNFKSRLATSAATNTSNTTNKGGTEEMQCTFSIDGKATRWWFDGQKIHILNHIDQLNIVRQIYKDNNGHDMPHYDWKSSAPWYTRLKQAIEANAGL